MNGIVKSSKVAYRNIEDQVVLIDPEGENVMILTEVGSFIWNLLDGNMDQALLLDKILEQFDVEREIAEKDLQSFLDQLEERGLIGSKR
jgi:Coenzyme PQQ synthesis protein D (PqqD)